MSVRTLLERPLKSVRRLSKIFWRLRNPDLHEIYMEPLRFEQALRKSVHPASNCVDVGAHLGGILSSLVKLAPQGKHFAFEAVPRKVQWLRRKFPEVEVHQVAVGDRSGEVPFYESAEASALSTLRAHAKQKISREIKVTCVRLDDCLPSDYRPDFLKIDVVGAELQVLRGAASVLELSRPVILFSSNRRKLATFQSTPGDLYDCLTQYGYAVFFLKDYLRGGNKLQLDRFDEAHEYPFQASNFIALPAALP